MPDFVPVDHDPFESDLASTMTHQPERPNPAAPYLDAVKQYLHGGVPEILRNRGVDVLPDWMNTFGSVFQNPDNQAAMGMAASWAPRAAQLFGSGLSYSQIAERLGTSRGAVAGTLRDMRSAGSMAPTVAVSKSLSDLELWNAAKDLRAKGSINSDIARKLGISPQSVSEMFKRGGGADMTPSVPVLKSMQRPAEEISPADMKEFLKTFRFEPVDHNPFE